MSSFTFNGISSDDLGIMITKPIVRPTWSRIVNEETSGAISKLMQQLKTYDNSEFPVYGVITDATEDNMRLIYQTLNGRGRMIISTAPHEYMNVFISPITPQPVALMMSEIVLSIVAQPFAYAVNPTGQVITQDFEIIRNGGTIFAAPEIMLKPRSAGDISIDVNGASFVIKVPSELIGKTIIVDCEVQVAYYLGDNNEKISITHMTYNDFPLLKTGENYIKYSGSASDVVCNVRERWL